MSQNNVLIAEAYYNAVGEKNVALLEKYLHPDVQFIGPLAKMTGRENVLEATKKFTNLFTTLTVRSKFGLDDQTMIVYDLEVPPPIGFVSSASLMTFKDGLVIKIELFYDARPFESQREQIFDSKSTIRTGTP